MQRKSTVLLELVLCCCWASASYGSAPDPAVAEIVLRDGKIVTLGSGDAVASWIAIADGKILAVGEGESVQRWMGPATTTMDLNGRTVIPGIIETHCHAMGVARGVLQQPYVELRSIGQVQAWLRQAAERTPPGRWIRVPRTDITRLVERRHPTPAELDAGCASHPVVFNAARKNVLNSLGLQRAGVESDTRQVGDGRVIRDAAGRPRMLAGGNALLRSLISQPEHNREQILEALRQVHRAYNRVGITSIFERAAGTTELEAYRSLRQRGQLTVRANFTIRQQFREGSEVEPFVNKLGLKPGQGDSWIKLGPLKITVDGGIHWGNTYLSEPYGQRRSDFYVLDDPDYRGDRRYTAEQMTSIFLAGHRLGWQWCCHVTGDAGVAQVLEALAEADRQLPVRHRRFTLTHAYFPDRASIQRARELGVCVDTQSYLYYRDSEAIAEVYGLSWAKRFIGVGDWLQGGVRVAINSDHMIGMDPDHAMNAFNPFLQMEIAVSRKNDAGKVYGQRISRLDALRCMTSTAAYLSFDEALKGTLEAGKVADLVVLDRDFLECPEEQIRKIRVLTTMVGGKIVYRSP